MLDQLKFVQGAVAKKDFVPSLTHFMIKDGLIKGYNGTLGLCGRIACELDVAPHAAQFMQAIKACKDVVTLVLNDKGQLIVKSGKFKTKVEVIETDKFPDIEPDGEIIPLEPGFLDAVKTLVPFVAVDASRPWACGVLFDGQSAFATNNVVIAELWLGYNFPFKVNVPMVAIKEILRIKEDPIGMRITESRLTLIYENDRWLTTQMSSLKWPDVNDVLNKNQAELEFEMTDEMFDALEQIEPFTCELGKVYFHGTCMSTHKEPDESSSVIEISCPEVGCYNVKQLMGLRGAARRVAFQTYPQPSAFTNDTNVRGILAGYVK